MLKNQAVLEIKRDERTYQLILSSDSPLGECFDVINEMRAFIIEKMNEIVEKQTKENPDKE